MEARTIRCGEGSVWRVLAPGRSSPYRLQLVFESIEGPPGMFRAEAEADRLGALSDAQLCFLLRQVQQAEE